LVHRDVKPSNILLTGWPPEPGGAVFAYLVDFGIAHSSAAGSTQTATQGTFGTVAYMAPERIAGQPGDRRSDVYALACVLYEALSGRLPYEGEPLAIMYAHMNSAPPIIRPATGPTGLDAIIAKGMAKQPDSRYSSAGELARAARATITTPIPNQTPPTVVSPGFALPPPAAPTGPGPRVRRRNTLWAAAAVAAVAAAVGGWVISTAGSHGAPTPPATTSPPAASTTSVSLAACETAHQMHQATTTSTSANSVVFRSCSAGPGADPDGFRVITVYTVFTGLDEASDASQFDFITGPCSTFQLIYVVSEQGTHQILAPTDVTNGTIVFHSGDPFSLATATPPLSQLPVPGTGQAVTLHNTSAAIDQASCVTGGATPGPLPPLATVSALPS
jgi:serine/threonine protein kinase